MEKGQKKYNSAPYNLLLFRSDAFGPWIWSPVHLTPPDVYLSSQKIILPTILPAVPDGRPKSAPVPLIY